MDTISQFSVDSTTSADSKEPVYIAAGDIRKRLSDHFTAPKSKFEVRNKPSFIPMIRNYCNRLLS